MVVLYRSVTASGGYDYTSLPVLITAFAAAFLGSVLAPLLSGPVNTLLDVDEVRVPGVGNIEVPRLLWSSL